MGHCPGHCLYTGRVYGQGGFTNDLILIVKALRGVGANLPIFGAGPAGADSIGKGLGAAADRLFAPMTWNWDLPIPGNKEFVAAYKALEKAASRDPQKIRDVLADTEFTGLPFPATKVKFCDNGLNVHNESILTEWMKGELRTVWPKEVQAIQPVL